MALSDLGFATLVSFFVIPVEPRLHPCGSFFLVMTAEFPSWQHIFRL